MIAIAIPTSQICIKLNNTIAEYSSPLWSPFYKSDIESVERIQINFTRYAMHYPLLNYKELRCEIITLLPLSFRLYSIDFYYLNLFYSILIYIRLLSYLLQPQKLRTETYKGFYTNRIVTLWNQLPPTLRVDQSFSVFVNELEVFYLKKFKDTFLCNNVCSWTSIYRCQACACF